MEKDKNTDLAGLVKVLPGKPGIYQFLDEQGKIIYIGKAKNLKKRVASYFKEGPSHSGKISVMVKKIRDIHHMVVDSELDALLLENNLIKKYQPRYNVMLKDDKTFPWICIKNERFPRIFPTRNSVDDGSEYFGPYASGRMMHTVLELIRSLYPLRNCKHNLSKKNVEGGKFRVCLEYHLGNCLAPCVGKQSEENYTKNIDEIREIIRGNISTIIRELKKMMMKHAAAFEFEKAQIIKEKLGVLENYQSKSTVVNPKINNVDVFSIITDQKFAYVNFLRVVNGAIVQAHTVELKKKLEEPDDELLGFAITDLRQRFGDSSKELILPIRPAEQLPGVKILIPARGDKKQLLELSERNSRYYKLEKQKKLDLTDPERHTRRILETMKNDLRMKQLPVHIECFDNSNLQGDYPVAAMVCFKNARPAKKEYRHFNIRSVEGPNDFASMEEIIYRRYKRLQDEKKSLPQLIVIDGGKGQLSSALKSLEKLGLRGKITIIGIAKKLEEIYYPTDSVPLFLDKTSETLRVIRHLRDEAHRFGITHHRKRMEKGTIKSELTAIEGIGFNTAQKLLWKFKSVNKIREAGEEELAAVIGKAKAGIVFQHFHKKQ
ncbi:MAG: excinuclease ABC subunit UvrC [Bacteroidales bacterium]|nr:excinuclease ABC subunit UvrC [Bacteroidales bacterium]